MSDKDGDSDESHETVDANDDVALQEDEETDEKPPLPVAGFGSARYGMLGVFNKSLAQADPEDVCEISCPSWRYVHGYQGRKAFSMEAGESHAGLLMEQEGESDGGKVFTHGMANLGRLGIGPARKMKKSLLGRLRVKGKGSGDPILDNPEPDFSALVAEPDPDDYHKEDTRYQPTPTKVEVLEKVSSFSLGSNHGALVTSEGEVYIWGCARHGRLGIGEAATDSSLPFDEVDSNDTYIPRPTLLQMKVKMSVVSCGDKHSLACDEYGVCYSWGSARYGKLGQGPFEDLPLEPSDMDGNYDPYSWHCLSPQKVSSFGTVTVSEVFAGAYNSFALHRVDNQPSVAFAWGLARYGLLGVGESPSSCCWTSRFDPGVSAEECPQCQKKPDTSKASESTVFVEGRIGHTPFSLIRVSEPAELQKNVVLESDPEDDFDKYVPYPVEVPAMASLNLAKICCGKYHHLAISTSGQIYSWGLLRHGRCGVGKFDPESQFNVRAGRVIFDRSVKTFPREDRYDIDFKGTIKVSIHDKLSWYLSAPALVVGLQSKKIVSASAGEMHSAAVTDDGKLYTWGCARHGRLGTKDAWDHLLLDSEDVNGRYRALPVEVTGLKVSLVACSSCSTLVVGMPGEPFPPWLEQQIQESKKKRGLFSSVFASNGAKGRKSSKVSDVPGKTPDGDPQKKGDEKGGKLGGAISEESLGGEGRKDGEKCHIM